MILATKVFGIRIEIILIVMLVLILILGVVLILTINRLNFISRKYYSLMTGKGGRDLEKIIRTRFKEMDKIKKMAKRVNEEHKEFKGHLDSCYNKMGIVKYDAFDQNAGELSSAMAILNEENSGMVLNAIHTKQGCYTYIKEITNGESEIPLSSEEAKAIDIAKNSIPSYLNGDEEDLYDENEVEADVKEDVREDYEEPEEYDEPEEEEDILDEEVVEKPAKSKKKKKSTSSEIKPKKKKYEPAEELEQSDKPLTYEERMMADIKRRIAEKVDEETPDYDFDE